MTNDTTKMIHALETQLAAIKAELARTTRDQGTTAKQRTAILNALPKSGGMTVAQLCEACQLTKGTAWRRIQELDRAAQVWLRTKYLDGGRKHTIVYHADAVAT